MGDGLREEEGEVAGRLEKVWPVTCLTPGALDAAFVVSVTYS